MSDIPELDRLIEEHAVFRANIAWDRSERMQLTFFRVFFACLATAVASVVFALNFSSLIAWVGGLATFVLSFTVLKRFLPDPPFRDPFKKYKYM